MPIANLPQFRLSNLLSGAYPQIPESTLWLIHSAYRFDRATPMRVNYPDPNAGAYAAHKWADTKTEFSVRLCWEGGEPPYEIIECSTPEWAQLHSAATINGTRVQRFDRILTNLSGIYEHRPASGYATVSGTPATEHIGQEFVFSYLIRDQTLQFIKIFFVCTVDDSGRIKYLSSGFGSDSGTGMYDDPYATFPKMWNLANGEQFIFKLLPGTYSVSNGSGGNAGFSSVKPKSILGAASADQIILDQSIATFAGGGNDITLKNVTVTGAPAAAANPRQLNLTDRVQRLHISGVRADPRVGTNGGDNPCFLFTGDNVSSPHSKISLVDCELLSTATASLCVLFMADSVIEENNRASGIVFPQTDGSLISHAKGKITNYTQRFNSYSADSDNGLTWVSNQNPEVCANAELACNFYENINSSGSAVRFNGQVHSAPMIRPPGQLIQRCSISAGNHSPVNFESYVTGDDVEYSGLLWSSSTATVIDATGGASLANPSLKVSDVSVVTEAMIGKGHKLLSPLVT